MDFRKKIDKILTVKQIKLWKLAKDSGLGSTLEKAYSKNVEMRPTTTEKFLQNLDISTEWWSNPENNPELKTTSYQKNNTFEDRSAKLISLEEKVAHLKEVNDLLAISVKEKTETITLLREEVVLLKSEIKRLNEKSVKRNHKE